MSVTPIDPSLARPDMSTSHRVHCHYQLIRDLPAILMTLSYANRPRHKDVHFSGQLSLLRPGHPTVINHIAVCIGDQTTIASAQRLAQSVLLSLGDVMPV